jgi:hypothetical protein
MKKAILIMILAMMSFLQAATVYVATDGNDTTGDGTVGNKWKTINKAITTASSPATIVCSNGTYSETSTGVTNGLNIPTGTWIIQSASGDACDVIITGTSDTYTVRVYGASGTLTCNDITLSSATANANTDAVLGLGTAQSCIINDCNIVNTSTGCGVYAYQTGQRTLTLNNTPITTQGAGISVASTGLTALTINGSSIHSTVEHGININGTLPVLDINESSIHAIAAGKNAIYTSSIANSKLGVLTIEDSTLSSDLSIAVYFYYGTLTSADFDTCHFDANDYGVWVSQEMTSCGRVDVHDSIFDDCGVQIAGYSTAPIIRNNNITINTDNAIGIITGTNAYPNSTPLGMVQILDNTITFVGANSGHGILSGCGSIYSYISGNNTFGADYAIVSKENSSVLKNNTIYQNENGIVGIYNCGQVGCVMLNNSIYAVAGDGIVVQDEGFGDGGPLLSGNTRLFNNAIRTTGAYSCIKLAAESVGQANTLSDWNCLYNATDSAVLSIESVIVPAATVGVAAWTDATKTITQAGAFVGYTRVAGDTFQPTAGTGLTGGQRVAINSNTDNTIVLTGDISTGGNVADVSGNVMRTTTYTKAQVQASLTGTTLYTGLFGYLCEQNSLFENPQFVNAETSDFNTPNMNFSLAGGKYIGAVAPTDANIVVGNIKKGVGVKVNGTELTGTYNPAKGWIGQ